MVTGLLNPNLLLTQAYLNDEKNQILKHDFGMSFGDRHRLGAGGGTGNQGEAEQPTVR